MTPAKTFPFLQPKKLKTVKMQNTKRGEVCVRQYSSTYFSINKKVSTYLRRSKNSVKIKHFKCAANEKIKIDLHHFAVQAIGVAETFPGQGWLDSGVRPQCPTPRCWRPTTQRTRLQWTKRASGAAQRNPQHCCPQGREGWNLRLKEFFEQSARNGSG